MAHHRNCADFRGMDPGFAPTGDEFITTYRERFDQFPIHIYKECLGCCLAYLTVNRNYTRLVTQPGLFYVHFPVVVNPEDRFRTPSVTSFARKPRGPKGVMGQIATGHDPNLGFPYRRPFQESRTYQLYVPYGPDGEAARGLSIGFPCNARMESVAIDEADQTKHYDIADIKLNFADAMLVERYKEMSDKPQVCVAFTGYCMTPPVSVKVDALVEGMQKVAIKEQPKKTNVSRVK